MHFSPTPPAAPERITLSPEARKTSAPGRGPRAADPRPAIQSRAEVDHLVDRSNQEAHQAGSCSGDHAECRTLSNTYHRTKPEHSEPEDQRILLLSHCIVRLCFSTLADCSSGTRAARSPRTTFHRNHFASHFTGAQSGSAQRICIHAARANVINIKPRDSISMGVSKNAKMTLLFVPRWLAKQSHLTSWTLDLEVRKPFSLFFPQ